MPVLMKKNHGNEVYIHAHTREYHRDTDEDTIKNRYVQIESLSLRYPTQQPLVCNKCPIFVLTFIRASARILKPFRFSADLCRFIGNDETTVQWGRLTGCL